MKVFFNFKEISKSIKPLSSIITWGIFDGVHRGHQTLIKNVINWAKKTSSPSLLITFRNHPERVLNVHNDPLFITSLSHRIMLLEQLGIDNCLVLDFNKKLSRLSAKDFIEKVIKTIKPAGIVVTKNILFGKDRLGNIHTLRNILAKHRIGLKIIKPVQYRKKIISSSLIRKEIQNGFLHDAQKMLGRPVTILGTVVRGEGRGRILGFPTANLDPHHEILPPRGVYIAKAQCLEQFPTCPVRSVVTGSGTGNNVPSDTSNGVKMQPCPATAASTFKALVNIGIKPTFQKKLATNHKEAIEVYLLNYNQEKYHSLYGKNILVEIISRLRDEKKFSHPDLLVNQIKLDIKKLRPLPLTGQGSLK
ncbi:MAG: bifunctional riboflavin kinase/FMN adenylyltransferase [Planctomycetota bacterium]